MKPKTRFLAFLLVLTLLPVSLGPTANASHLTWTNVVVQTYNTPSNTPFATSPEVVKVFGSTIYVGSNIYGASGDLALYKSTDNAATWSSVGIITPDWDANGYDFEIIDANNMVACYVASVPAVNTIYVRTSSTGGGLWSEPVAVSADGVSGACDVTVLGSTYVVVYGDTVEADVEAKLSTDNGLTWGAEIDIQSTEPVYSHATLYRHIQVAKKNTTTALLAFTGGISNDPFVSLTTDAGVSWSAPASLGAIATTYESTIDLRYVSDNRYDAVVSIGTNVYFCTSGSSGAAGSWNCNANAATGTDLKSVALEVNPTDTTEIIIVWQDDGTEPLQYSFSTDGGANFDAADGIRTYGTTLIGTRINSALLPNGNVAVFYHTCKQVDGTTDIDCANASADVVKASVSHAAFADVSEALSASATASVTNLVGFDVDPTGSIAIARTELGENVAVWNAQTLGTSVSGTIDTNCAVGTNAYEDAVMAKSMVGDSQSQLVGFLNCDAGGDSQYLSIRQADGSVPTTDQFNGCTPVDAGVADGCEYNIDLLEFDEPIDSGLGQLGQIRDFPIDYSSQGSYLGFTQYRTAWAWASQQCDNPPGPSYCDGTEPGLVGIATHTDPQLVDPENTDSVTHSPSQDVDDFCLGLDGTNYYLASVVSGQPGRTWSVTFSETDSDSLDAAISNSPSSFGSSGFGIACGGGQLLHIDGDDDVQLLTRTGVFVTEVVLSDSIARGVSISDEFIGPSGSSDTRGYSCTTALDGTGGCVQYGVYVDDSTDEGVILNLTGGVMDEVGRITLPTGTFHSIRMDRLGQNVWVATSTTIARFEVLTVTTVDPINIPGDEDSADDSTSDGDASFTVPEEGSLAGVLLLGSVLVMAMGLALLKWAPTIGACVFVAGGLMMGSAFGIIPGWALMLTTACLLVGLFVLSRRGATAG